MFYTLENLSSTNRYLLTALLIILVITVWWIFLYKPLKTSIQILENELLSANKVYQISDNNNLIIESIEQELSSLEKEYGSRVQELDTISNRIATVIDLIKKSELTFLEFNESKKSKQNNQFAIISFEGKFEQILKFFSDLGENLHLIECSKCSISKIDKNKLYCSCLLFFSNIERP